MSPTVELFNCFCWARFGICWASFGVGFNFLFDLHCYLCVKIFSFDYCCGDEFLGGICRHPVGTYCFIGTHMGELGVLFIDVSCLFFIKVCLFCCDIHLL